MEKEINKKFINKELWQILLRLAFEYSFIFYLILYLADNLVTNFVSRFYSFNIHLSFVLLTGLLTLIFPPVSLNINKPKNIRILNWFVVLMLALISSAIIFAKTYSLGWISYIFAIITFLLIIIIFILFKNNSEEELNN